MWFNSVNISVNKRESRQSIAQIALRHGVMEITFISLSFNFEKDPITRKSKNEGRPS